MILPVSAVSEREAAMPVEGLAFDEIIEQALILCSRLPDSDHYRRQRDLLADLSERLAGGRLHLAVLGQFNRGKSSFINALLGMPVLPVSVLPITTVPTVIVYAARVSCTVEFNEGKEPVQVFDSLETISDVLRRYVAEDTNPRNERGVARVTLACPSDMLRHGTMLIDTPGFGSTHVHNTETALKLVEGCDAALFLLSADLPITQVEVDFLKEIRKYVPRIFFIYNKTDLLSADELAATGDYIIGVLKRSLAMPDTVRIFPICARAGMEARRQAPDDERWRTSGMEAVKTGIIDFLLREKYFALSEALSEKCMLALDTITTALAGELSALRAPLVQLDQKLAAARSHVDAAHKDIDIHMGLVPHEEKALCRLLDEICAARKDNLHRLIDDAMEPLLAAAALRHGNYGVIYSSAKKLLDEMFAALFAQICGILNTTLRRNLSAHQKALERMCRAADDIVGSAAGAEADGMQELSDIQIDPSPGWRPAVAFDEPKAAWPQRILDRVQSPRRRLQAYKKSILPLLHEYGDHCLQDMANALRTRIHAACALLSEVLFKHFSIRVTTRVLRWQSEQQAALIDRTAVLKPQMDKLEELSRRFSALKAALV